MTKAPTSVERRVHLSRTWNLELMELMFCFFTRQLFISSDSFVLVQCCFCTKKINFGIRHIFSYTFWRVQKCILCNKRLPTCHLTPQPRCMKNISECSHFIHSLYLAKIAQFWWNVLFLVMSLLCHKKGKRKILMALEALQR